MKRREFLKAGSALLLLPALPGSRLLAAVGREDYLGNALREVQQWTTINKTIVPPALAKAFDKKINWNGAAALGETLVLRNDLINRKQLPSRSPKTLMFFGQMTDIHIVDEESPARLVAAEPYLELLGINSAFHPQEDLGLQVLNSMIGTLNKISGHNSLQFLLNTGDTIDNAHEIELLWYLNAISGKMVDPDSGTNQDPVPGAGNDANDPFKAVGLDSNIPCYGCIGNHDILLQGNIPPFLREVYNAIVEKYLNIMLLHDPVGDKSNAILKPWATPPDLEQLKPGKIGADPRRKTMDGRDFIMNHLKHERVGSILGFPKVLAEREYAFYSFKPLNDLPFKVIVLDTTSRLGTALGVIDKEQYQDFLIPELESAKKDKELVIVVSHHPSGSLVDALGFRDQAQQIAQRDELLAKMVGEILPKVNNDQAFVSENKLQETLKAYPNVFLHVAGHTHGNTVNPIGKRGNGYWEVVTASLLTFPQQSRLFEVVYEGNGIGAVHTCVVDHQSAPESLAAYSRNLAYHDQQSHDFAKDYLKPSPGTRTDRNTILRFEIPAEIAAKL